MASVRVADTEMFNGTVEEIVRNMNEVIESAKSGFMGAKNFRFVTELDSDSDWGFNGEDEVMIERSFITVRLEFDTE